jgi:hypothetical protein
MFACCELMKGRVEMPKENFQMRLVADTPETALPQSNEVLKGAERAFGFIRMRHDPEPRRFERDIFPEPHLEDLLRQSRPGMMREASRDRRLYQ